MNASKQVSYLNTINHSFQKTLHSEIYVDKSGLLSMLNKKIGTENCYICVSRPRRFGKSVTAKMLAAYYGREQNNADLFDALTIAHDASYKKHLNKYNTIFINMADELVKSHKNVQLMLDSLSAKIINDLRVAYPQITFSNSKDLEQCLSEAFSYYGIFFVVIIDEWDCIMREKKDDVEGIRDYLDWLKLLLKDKAYIGLAYITGILPIKKYGTQSALNMFDEFNMLNPSMYAPYIGFTASEVMDLCNKYHVDYMNMAKWYDGYSFPKAQHIYNPKSVVQALDRGEFISYWTRSETFESLKSFVDMNFDGLREDIIKLLANEDILINFTTFTNDMSSFATKDDVFTLLLHLGYLSLQTDEDVLQKYPILDRDRMCLVHIPNQEIKNEFISTMYQNTHYAGVYDLIHDTNVLLNNIYTFNGDAVAKIFDKAHEEHTSILKYNDENSLACVITLSLLLCCRDLYDVRRELPAGKGFADLVYIPKKGINKPALLIELKFDQSAQSAIEQIKTKQYTNFFANYCGDVLLVGINYNKKTKHHECLIEKFKQ